MISSKELERLSQIKIDRWIDIQSEEANEFCPEFNKIILRILNSDDPHPFIIDELGRIYAKADDVYNPLHDEFCGEKIGYRVVKKAIN